MLPLPFTVYSEEDNANINRIAAAAEGLFQPESLSKCWTSKTELTEMIKSFAVANGFTVAQYGWAFYCSRASDSSSHETRRLANSNPESKRRKTQSQRCGCTFVIKYTNALPKVTNAPNGSLRVTGGSCFYHSNGCMPGIDQLRCCNIANGHYSKLVMNHSKTQVLFELMRHTDQTVNSKIIRDILRPILPEGVPITSLFICNLRNKIRLQLQQGNDSAGMETVKASIDKLSRPAATGEHELESLESFPASYIDNASRNARLVLRQALKETTDGARIHRLLHDLRDLDSNFQFEVAFDSRFQPCGYVWMTPWQRAAFEQYGDVVFLDCMKRKQNSIDWPYIGPVVLDGDNKMIVIVESICCSERLEAYEFVMNAAFRFTPRRPRNTVKVIYGDGIMSDRLLANLGIKDSCKLCLDTYHLLNVDWPRKFGLQLFSSLQKHLQGLVYTKTEAEYYVHYDALKSLLSSKPNHLTYLTNEIHGNRHRFSRCYVQNYEGKLLLYFWRTLAFLQLIHHSTYHCRQLATPW